MAENEGEYKVGPGRPPKEHQFKKGQSGNPAGRPKGRRLTDLIIEILEREFRGKVTLEMLAEVIVKNGMMGKWPFIKEIWDRLEGKTPDRVEVAGRDGPAVVFEIVETTRKRED